MMHSVSSYTITVNHDVISIFPDSERITLESDMSSLQTARGIMALAFKKSELVYLHCVSKEKFGVTLKGFTCISLICREAHVSYIEKMSERRQCLVPDVVEHQPVDALFEDQGTPLLVRINSSCDITVGVLVEKNLMFRRT